MMDGYAIKEAFDNSDISGTEENGKVYANVWAPKDADWTRIYFSDSPGKGGTTFGYIWVGSTVLDTDKLLNNETGNAIRDFVEDLTNDGGSTGQTPPRTRPSNARANVREVEADDTGDAGQPVRGQGTERC